MVHILGRRPPQASLDRLLQILVAAAAATLIPSPAATVVPPPPGTTTVTAYPAPEPSWPASCEVQAAWFALHWLMAAEQWPGLAK
jgi:hypothetical protein